MQGAHLAPHEVHALLLLRRAVEDARHALARARSMLTWPAPQQGPQDSRPVRSHGARGYLFRGAHGCLLSSARLCWLQGGA